MKNNLQTNPLLFKMIVLITCFMLVMLYNKSKAANKPDGSQKNTFVAFKHTNSKITLPGH